MWKLTLAILLFSNTIGIILNKAVADKIKEKSMGVFYQYLFQFLFSVVLVLSFFAVGRNTDVKISLGLLSVGFITAFGNYFMWRAFDFSLSRTALFFPLHDALSVFMVLIFLPVERKIWSIQLTTGVGLCFLAMWLCQPAKDKSGNSAKKEVLGGKWLFFTLAMVIIFTMTNFFARSYSMIPMGTFLLSFFGGNILGIIPILLLERQSFLNPPKIVLTLGSVMSLAHWAATVAIVWTYKLGGPASLVLPLRGVCITAIPALFGWFVLKEGKSFSKKELFGVLLGSAGAALILFK
jgi:drug/metabolite transporter (DMT)-like permease